MKNLYILLLSLACSTAVLAQTPDTQWVDMTDGQSIVGDVLSEEIFVDENLSEEMTAEDAFPEEIVDLNSVPEDVLMQIQQDCSILAQNEGVEEAMSADFIETCVIDGVAMDIAANQEESDTEMLTEEYAEAPVEDAPVELITE